MTFIKTLLCASDPSLDPNKVNMQQMTCDFYKFTMEKIKSKLEELELKVDIHQNIIANNNEKQISLEV